MMNVLFIGNSYTFYNNMPNLFRQLACANGKEVNVYSVTKGGRKLISYKDPLDPVTAQLDQLLTEHEFDVCFIQEQSVLPVVDLDLFMEGFDCVVNKVKNCARQLIMYATWGRKCGSETLEKYEWTTEEMTDLLSKAYEKAASCYGALVSPVGINFLKATKNHPKIDLYNVDRSHPSYQGSCLAALTHFVTLFGEFPKNTDTLSLSPEEISAFRLILCA